VPDGNVYKDHSFKKERAHLTETAQYMLRSFSVQYKYMKITKYSRKRKYRRKQRGQGTALQFFVYLKLVTSYTMRETLKLSNVSHYFTDVLIVLSFLETFRNIPQIRFHFLSTWHFRPAWMFDSFRSKHGIIRSHRTILLVSNYSNCKLAPDSLLSALKRAHTFRSIT
jgi:hypothetical protein